MSFVFRYDLLCIEKYIKGEIYSIYNTNYSISGQTNQFENTYQKLVQKEGAGKPKLVSKHL